MTQHNGNDDDARGAVMGLLHWYRPYLVGQRSRLIWVGIGTVIVLACQAVIPWLVEVILHHGEWDAPMLLTFVGLVIIQLSVSYVTHLGAHQAANESARTLRSRLFERLLRSRVLRQQGLLRSSVVMRMTSDVDHTSDAFESTLADGFPGLARLVISLALLTYIEWKAGLAMALASLAFLLLRRRIGQRLLIADRERLLAQSRLGETVDESISTSRTIAGLHLTGWQLLRFEHRSETVEHRTHTQGVIISRLILAAHSAGLMGLVIVVIFALVLGGGDLATWIAALLYVEGAVRGMEALPPWIRAVQLSAVSQRRLDDVLSESDRITVPAGAPGPTPNAPMGLSLESVSATLPSGVTLDQASLRLPPGAVVGLVTQPGTEPDDVLGLLSGDVNPSSGRVVIDGIDIRTPTIAHHVFYVPDEAEAFSSSALELLDAVAPGTSAEQATAIAASVSLEHIVTTPHGINEPLGPGGLELTVSERQRLMLAVAIAAQPRVLLVGSLLALADIDGALPLIDTLRAGGQESTVISVRSAEVAEAVDLILFVAQGQARTASHQELLVSVPEYAALWEQRLSTIDVDLSIVGIDPADEHRMLSRLVTEHYSPGDLIYREGAPSDRIVFIISGHVEITTNTADGSARRVAVLGPGNHCGDLRLTVGERRAESAVALDDCVVRSLSRQAIAAGLTGLLDRTASERRIIESLLRDGPGTAAEVGERLPGIDDATFASSLALLVRDGAVRNAGGILSVVLQRSAKTGARDLLDRLGDM